MKKKIAAALILTMTFGMGNTVFAAGIGEQNPIDVTARYNDNITTQTVYSVDLEWEDMTFTYRETGSRTWNPATHTYTDNTSSGWDKTSAAVTATNHSNVPVEVGFVYQTNDVYGVNASMSKDSFALSAGEEGKPGEAAADSSNLNISGIPNEKVTAEGIVIGTITVTIR